MELELQLKDRWLVSLACQPSEHFSTVSIKLQVHNQLNINNDKQRLLSVAPWFQLCSLSGVQTSLVGTNPPSWGLPSHTEISGDTTIHLGLPFHKKLSNVKVWKWESLSCVPFFETPWNSPGQNTGVGSLSLLQGIFPTQRSNPRLPHCRQILYQLSHKGSSA